MKIVCEELLNETISSIKSLPGGDVNQCFNIETLHNSYFCKTNSSTNREDILQKELLGLKCIGRYCSTPKIVNCTEDLLILEWVKTGSKTRFFWEKLGKELSDLHKVSSNQFGYEHTNYIGSLNQENNQSDSWSTFYTESRLMPQLKLAVDKGLISALEVPSIDKISKKIQEVCPSDVASLVHGDLWSGNILCDTDSNVFFIDPSISYSHREMDIAMSALFGKFDDKFYNTYDEIYPLEKGWKARLDIYQLYHLLTHLNMFGIGYKNDVLKIVNRYFA